jgi:ketosteroid isomerase-like protein
MKRSIVCVIGLLVSIPGIVSVYSQASRESAGIDPNVRPFVSQVEAATNRFINGDVTLWNQIASHQQDATIMGAWGGYEKGWNEVGPRYGWASSRLKESGAKVTVEYLSSVVSGDLAYTVAIERSETFRVDQDKPTPLALRVTHIFRKENGAWKLLHRHADPLMIKTAPGPSN